MMQVRSLLTLILLRSAVGLECHGWRSNDVNLPSSSCDAVCLRSCKIAADRGSCMVNLMGTKCEPPMNGPPAAPFSITPSCNGWSGSADVTDRECDGICHAFCEGTGDIVECMSQVQPAKCTWPATNGNGSGESLCSCLEPAFEGVTAEACELMCETGKCNGKESITDVVDCVTTVAGGVAVCRAQSFPTTTNRPATTSSIPTTTSTTTKALPNGNDACNNLIGVIQGIDDAVCQVICQQSGCAAHTDAAGCTNSVLGVPACAGPTTTSTTSTTKAPPSEDEKCKGLIGVVEGIDGTVCELICQQANCAAQVDAATCTNNVLGVTACAASGESIVRVCADYKGPASQTPLSDNECVEHCQRFCHSVPEGTESCMTEHFPVCQ